MINLSAERAITISVLILIFEIFGHRVGTARHWPWQCHRRSRRQIFHVRLFQHSGHGISSAGKSRRHKHVDQTGLQETIWHSEVSCLMWIALTLFINGSEKIRVIIEHDFKAQRSNRKEIYLLYSHTEHRCIFSELQSIKKEAGVTLLLLLWLIWI